MRRYADFWLIKKTPIPKDERLRLPFREVFFCYVNKKRPLVQVTNGLKQYKLTFGPLRHSELAFTPLWCATGFFQPWFLAFFHAGVAGQEIE